MVARGFAHRGAPLRAWLGEAAGAHPARWLRKRKIGALRGFAVDSNLQHVTHIEDAHTHGALTFAPVAVPCRNADVTLFTAPRPRRVAELPACDVAASSGWYTGADTYELIGGEVLVEDVYYDGAPGAQAFRLGDDLYEVDFQEAVAVVPEGEDVVCRRV